MAEITFRFVASTTALSAAIRFQAGIAMPFAPSHVECLSRDGKSYVGQHLDGGMEARPIGYDADTLLAQKLVTFQVTDQQHDDFHDFVESKIGQPYDWKSILSFADPALNFHLPNHAICSAIMTQAARQIGLLRWPLVVPFHHISPRDLMLIFSALVEVSHEVSPP